MVGCGISVGYLHLQIPEFEKIYIIIQFHVEVTFGIRGVTGRRGRASQESQESQVSVCQVQQSSSTRRRPTITYLPITLPKGLIMVAIKSLDAYVGWTVAQGIQTPLELRSTRDGQYRYATASQPIAPEDTILRVPLASCLTAENLEALAERLKYESDAGARSKFEPYINMLPSFEQLHVLPRFWEGNLVETVTDGGQLESRIRRDKNDNLDPWALACVDSRANFIQDGFSMTPFLDM